MKNQFNSNSPIIASLDIGTTKTIIAVARKNEFDKLELIAYGIALSRGMRQAEVVNFIDVANSIKEALHKCYESNKSIKKINEVVVGIAGKHICCTQENGSLIRSESSMPITIEEIEKFRLQQYDNYVMPGDEIINVIPKYYQIDHKHIVLDHEIAGCVGKRIDGVFNVIKGNKEEMNKICNAVETAGLKIQKLYLQPLASSLSILTQDHKNAGVVLADLGGGTTDIAVFQNGTLCHTSVIDMAGNFITQNIYKGLNLFREEEAEQLKIQCGSCLPDMVKQNSNVTINGEKGVNSTTISLYQLSLNINHSVRTIIQQINQNLINNGINPKSIRGGIYLTGGTALLTHLKLLISHDTLMDAKIGFPIIHLAKVPHEKLRKPENATCYGLLLYGFELYEKFNLHNTDYMPVELYPISENKYHQNASTIFNENQNRYDERIDEKKTDFLPQNNKIEEQTELTLNQNDQSNQNYQIKEATKLKNNNFFSKITDFIDAISNEFKNNDTKID